MYKRDKKHNTGGRLLTSDRTTNETIIMCVNEGGKQRGEYLEAEGGSGFKKYKRREGEGTMLWRLAGGCI